MMPTYLSYVLEPDEMRNRIVDAAEALFLTRGYDSVSMDEIAKEAGLDKPVLSRYFKEKESLLFTVTLHGARTLNEAYMACSKIDADGLTRLNAMIDRYVEFASRYPGYFRLLRLTGEERFHVKFNREGITFRGLSLANLELVAEAIEQGKADGSIRKDLDARQAAMFIGVLQAGMLDPDTGWKNLMGEIGNNRMQEELRRFIGHAIASPASNPAPGKGDKGGIWPWRK